MRRNLLIIMTESLPTNFQGTGFAKMVHSNSLPSPCFHAPVTQSRTGQATNMVTKAWCKAFGLTQFATAFTSCKPVNTSWYRRGWRDKNIPMYPLFRIKVRKNSIPTTNLWDFPKCFEGKLVVWNVLSFLLFIWVDIKLREHVPLNSAGLLLQSRRVMGH